MHSGFGLKGAVVQCSGAVVQWCSALYPVVITVCMPDWKTSLDSSCRSYLHHHATITAGRRDNTYRMHGRTCQRQFGCQRENARERARARAQERERDTHTHTYIHRKRERERERERQRKRVCSAVLLDTSLTTLASLAGAACFRTYSSTDMLSSASDPGTCGMVMTSPVMDGWVHGHMGAWVVDAG